MPKRAVLELTASVCMYQKPMKFNKKNVDISVWVP